MTLHERFACVLPIEVRFRDVDVLGHVNNAVYMTYFEQGRVFYSMQLSNARALDELQFIVAEASVSYKRPAFYGEQLQIGVRVGEIGNKSFSLEYELWRGEDELIASGRSVQVWYDYQTARSAPVPASFRRAVAEAQAGLQLD